MESHGFLHDPFEFWHCSKGDAIAHILAGDSRPAIYGPVNWDPRSGAVVPVGDAFSPLNTLDVIELRPPKRVCTFVCSQKPQPPAAVRLNRSHSAKNAEWCETMRAAANRSYGRYRTRTYDP